VLTRSVRFLFLLTAGTVLVQNCCGRGREKKKTLSFEPEAGGQAPGHPQPYAYGGYQQVPLVVMQQPVVTQQPSITYDPYGAPKSAGWKEQELSFSAREVSGGAVEPGSGGGGRGGEKALPMPPGSGRREF
jgi:hypothetical protein